MTQPKIWPPVEGMLVLRKSNREELVVVERASTRNGNLFTVRRSSSWNYEWHECHLSELMPDDRDDRAWRGAALFDICQGLTLEQVTAAVAGLKAR
jgi:hypothetical protein